MEYLEQLFSDEIVRALGWTILHSLWQGTMIALILALLMVFLHRHSSTIRYFISATALVTVLVLSAVTFMGLYSTLQQPFEYTGQDAAMIRHIPNISGGYTIYTAPESEVNFWSSLTAFVDYFNQHLPLIVTIWLMGVAVLALRFLGGLAYVQRLKSYRTKFLPEVWENRMNTIAKKLDIKRKVKLLESSMVKVPMVIGHLKPVILLPIGTVTGLSVKQIEAILAHELAHIARNDYILNICQSVIDIIFFYHPAVWWISASVRSERENCCDDIAVQISSDSMAFARALTELQQVDHRVPGFAMAATGNKEQLFQRVKRLVESHQKNPTFKEGFLAACVLMISILSLSFSADADYDTATHEDASTQEIWVEGESALASAASVAHPEIVAAAEADKATAPPEPQVSSEATTIEEIEEEAPVALPIVEEIVEDNRAYAYSFATASATSSSSSLSAKKSKLASKYTDKWRKFDFGTLPYQGTGQPLQFVLLDTMNKKEQTVISSTLEDGRYFFARLNDDKEIVELFIEGQKIKASDFGKYQEEVKKHLRFVGQEQRILRERQRILENEQRVKLRQKQLELRQMQRQLEQHQRMTRQNLERMKSNGALADDDMKVFKDNMQKAMEAQQKELEKLQKELERATEELEKDSLLKGHSYIHSSSLWNSNGGANVHEFLSFPETSGIITTSDGQKIILAPGSDEDIEVIINEKFINGQVEKALDGVSEHSWAWAGSFNNDFNFSWDKNTVFESLKCQLKEDGFKVGKKFKFELNDKWLKINGKKQSAKMYEKYKELIECVTDRKLDHSYKYIFTD